MATAAVAAVMPDQVDFDEPRDGVIPLRPGPHRDLPFEQRTGLSATRPPHLVLRPLRRQPTINRGRRHRHQQLHSGLVNGQLPEMTQHRDQLGEHRRQTLARRPAQYLPAHRERSDDLRPIRAPPRPARHHDAGLQRCVQCLAGMTAVPAGVGTQLIKNHTLTALTGSLIAHRGRLSDCSTLPQRQPHPSDLRAHFQ